MLSSSRPLKSQSKAPRWYHLTLAVITGGLALQMGILPAAATVTDAAIQVSQSDIEGAIIPLGNVESNDDIPRRGDPRIR